MVDSWFQTMNHYLLYLSQMNVLLIILVVLIVIVCFASNTERYSSGKSQMCTQDCQMYCEPPIWKGQKRTCHLNCITKIDGNVYPGCKPLRSTPGKVPPYSCHVAEGRRCYEPTSEKYDGRHYPTFPKKGTCSQNCRYWCTGPKPKDCTLHCLTFVDGHNTGGCKNLRNTVGKVPPYPCHSTRTRYGRICMAADSTEK